MQLRPLRCGQWARPSAVLESVVETRPCAAQALYSVDTSSNCSCSPVSVGAAQAPMEQTRPGATRALWSRQVQAQHRHLQCIDTSRSSTGSCCQGKSRWRLGPCGVNTSRCSLDPVVQIRHVQEQHSHLQWRHVQVQLRPCCVAVQQYRHGQVQHRPLQSRYVQKQQKFLYTKQVKMHIRPLQCRQVSDTEQLRLLLPLHVQGQLRHLCRRHVQEQHRLLLSRQVPGGAPRSLWCKHVQVQHRPLVQTRWSRNSKGPCGVDTSRPAQAPVAHTRSGAAQDPVDLWC